MKTLKVGVVGCGHIATVHTPIFKRTKRSKVVSVCDLNFNRAKDFATRYEIPKAYSDLLSMLREEELDVLDVLTPPQAHALLAIEAMDAGCNVLVEKPMCVTVKEADMMIEASKRNNVTLGVVHSFLFNPAIQDALRILDSGKLGKLLRADITVSLFPLLQHAHPKWMNTLSGGLFGEIIPHGLYVLLEFIGHVHKVQCVVEGNGDLKGLFPFSDLHVLLNAEKSVGTLHMSTKIASKYTIMNVRATAEKGLLEINIPTATLIKTSFSKSTGLLSRASYNFNQGSQYLSSIITLGMKKFFGKVKPQMTHEILIEGFLESICQDKNPPVTAEDGKEVVRVINMIWDGIR